MNARAFWLCALALVIAATPAEAARIGETAPSDAWEKAVRFFAFRDPAVRYALAGSLLLGLCCGLMGSFLVVRKLSLMGDALSHAVLPGVALGFLWTMQKNPLAIFVGATAAGLLGAGTVQWIRQTTKHKEDAALGFVLASFFGAGICLLTMIQNLPGGDRAGLDKFMFGQAAAMGGGDVALLAAVAALALGAVGMFFKEFKLASFDPGFARAIGMRVQVFHYALMLLLSFAIVASLQAVGVVLVSAMLVIPAATAYLLAERMGPMLCLSAGLGMLAGGVGAFASFVGTNVPTGPYMVLAAGAVFGLAFTFGPRHGVATRWWRRRSRAARISRENTLKAIYRIIEDKGFTTDAAGIADLAGLRRETLEDAWMRVENVRRDGLVTVSGDAVSFTPAGWQRACEIVRNHRLWELYLTNAAQFSPDHVHDDAEEIEHMLGEETVRKLERRLEYARRDPHGRVIPGVEEMQLRPQPPRPTGATGFGTEGGDP